MLRAQRAVHAALLVVVAGCTVSPGVSSDGSPSLAASTGTPSPAVSTAPISSSLPFPTVELPPQSRARLQQTVMAFTSPGELPSREVAAGTEIVVVGGPRERGGETWYAIDYPLGTDQRLLPWVRIADPAAILAITPTCPNTPADALRMPAWDRLTCIGGTPVTVEGELGHCQGGVVVAEPEWLAYACWAIFIDGGGYLELHAAPAGGITFPDEIVRARLSGHFDDPAASTCRYTETLQETWQGPSQDEQILLCREAFVVDAVEILEVIGTPPAG